MIQVTFAKSNYTSHKNSPTYLIEGIKMMEGVIIREDQSIIIAEFPNEWKTKKLILSNIYFWANER
tara:strand:- start:2719 stop:2916 length:198 start_codon:yes stop_codon:yes gene_type:complete